MEDEMKYWMNDDTGHVIAMEECPSRLWSEIDFETYDALTRPDAKRANTACTPADGGLAESDNESTPTTIGG